MLIPVAITALAVLALHLCIYGFWKDGGDVETIVSLLTGGNSIFIALMGGLFAALIAWMRGRVTGARKERDKRATERLKAKTEADRIEDAVAGRDGDRNRKELGKWSGR